MPDIGATLRETRMRQRLDITQVEAATKIRAKYLRALENEEWDQLPGPTFVRTFLRTYADHLGLDSKMLVEEYKQRYQRPSPQELLPFSPRSAARRQRRSFSVPPIVVLGSCVVALLGALFALGKLGDGPSGGGTAAQMPAATATPRAQARPERRRRRTSERSKRRPAAARNVTVRIEPTGLVNVCLVRGGSSGRVLIRSQNLEAGATTDTFRARRFRVTFGNGNARMRVGGRTYDVPESDEPIGYDLRPGSRPRRLSAAARPTCQS